MNLFGMLKGLQAGLLALVFAHSMAAGAAEFFVAPNGTPQGDGSRERPWDLQTALNHPAAVKPGDTIWLRGGLYTNTKGDYNSKLRGTPEAPIIVRNYRGERATLKAHLGIGYGKWWPAAYSWYWGLEITNREIHPNRNGMDVASSRDYRPGIKIINCVIHDCGSCGIGFWAGAADSEVHGCLIYNCGYDGQARGSHRKARSYRGHGHGMYIQNEKGFKLIKNNVSFRQFGNGLSPHTTKAPRNNITLEQNAVFNSGEYSLIAPFQKNIEFQYGTVGRNGRMIRNCTYVPGGVRGSGIVAFGNNINAIVRDNLFVTNPPHGMYLRGDIVNLTMTGNTIIGPIRGFRIDQYGTGNVHLEARPRRGKKIFVFPNDYERGRANIIIYNWDRSPTVSVDVREAGLKRGEVYVVRDVQNWYGEPVARGTYDGKPIALPMTGLTVAPLLGLKNTGVPPEKHRTAPHTAPEFAVLVILPASPAEAARPGSEDR